jgi:hypothetical protein
VPREPILYREPRNKGGLENELDPRLPRLVRNGAGASARPFPGAGHRRRPGLPVLLTTGYAENTVIDGNGGGDAHVLRKPYRKRDLALEIRAALDPTRS